MKWIWSGVFFIIGLTIGLIARQFLDLTFKKDFDIAHILTIVLTLVVAAFLQYHALGRRSDIRAEKDIVIDQAKAILQGATEVRSRFLSCFLAKGTTEEDLRVMNLGLKTWSASMAELESVLHECKMISEKGLLVEVKEEFFEYKKLLTGGDLTLPYTPLTYNSSEARFKTIGRRLRLLILKVNRR